MPWFSIFLITFVHGDIFNWCYEIVFYLTTVIYLIALVIMLIRSSPMMFLVVVMVANSYHAV